MTSITDEIINNTPDEYNLFILLKKNMIKGELRLPNLSSKNRSLLHQVLQYANISNQLNTLRMFSYINLVMNVIIICNL